VKISTAGEIVLAGFLCLYATSLNKRTVALRGEAQYLRSIAAGDDAVTMRAVAGVDVSGHFVGPLSADDSERIAAFLLRGNRIGDDLTFWREVATLLPPAAHIRLVGYCDGESCAEAVRKLAPLDFPVIEYGEISDSQALINADLANALLVLSAPSHSQRHAWRVGSKTPAVLVRNN